VSCGAQIVVRSGVCGRKVGAVFHPQQQRRILCSSHYQRQGPFKYIEKKIKSRLRAGAGGWRHNTYVISKGARAGGCAGRVRERCRLARDIPNVE